MMPLSSGPEQRDLVVAVAMGVHEDPPWTTLARSLATRTRSDHVLIASRLGKAVRHATGSWEGTMLPRGGANPFDWPSFLATFTDHGEPLRAGRVYAVDELLALDRPDALAAQHGWLARKDITSVRLMRVATHGGADVLVALAKRRDDIQAAAVAMLSNLVPHLQAALHSLETIVKQRVALDLAETALSRLGIGQIAFDAEGTVLSADRTAASLLDLAPDLGPGTRRRLRLSAKAAQEFKSQLDELVVGVGPGVRILPLDETRDLCLLLRRSDLQSDGLAHVPAVIGVVRQYQPQQNRETALTIKALYQLSDREASLAHAISLGQPINETGHKLRLTKETARNYSKRIYSKTGTKGQSDLARLILNGLAPLA